MELLTILDFGGSMEYNRFCFILSFAINLSFIGTVVAQTRSQSTPDSISQYRPRDSVTINGTIIDSMSGGFSLNDSILVKIDSCVISPDSDGAFFKRVLSAQYHTLKIIAKQYAPFSQLIQENSGKQNYFLTCILHRIVGIKSKTDSVPVKRNVSSGPCWTISGCVVDSKHDLAIQSDSFTVTFDNSLIKVTKKRKLSGKYLQRRQPCISSKGSAIS